MTHQYVFLSKDRSHTNMPKLSGILLFMMLVTFSYGQRLISSEALQADIALLRQAYTELHPGLYRHNSPTVVDSYFDELAASLEQDTSLADTYLALSQFLAKLQDSHSYANYYNQSSTVQFRLFNRPSVPFNFRLIDNRMIVTENGSDDDRLLPGTEIVSIDGQPVADILADLLGYIRADGGNDDARVYRLQVSGEHSFAAFDVFFPLVFKPAETLQMTARVPNGEVLELRLPAMTPQTRQAAIRSRYGDTTLAARPKWEFNMLAGDTAYLRLSSFTVWNFDFDWQVFLEDAFSHIAEQNASKLILDLRGNSGGLDEVLDMLAYYLVDGSITLPAVSERLNYLRVADNLQPHLDSYTPDLMDLTGQVVSSPAGGYTPVDVSLDPTVMRVPQHPLSFRGELVVLTDAANSSAAFSLAQAVQTSGRGILLGQPTGGNQRGFTGGQYFFLRLPGSGIEVDIPLISYEPLGELLSDMPDSGVVPDVLVMPLVEDIANGVDRELQVALELLTANAAGETTSSP